MSGYWIPIWKNQALQELKGYLYCCSDCNAVTMDPKTEGCRKCGSPIDYENQKSSA